MRSLTQDKPSDIGPLQCQIEELGKSLGILFEAIFLLEVRLQPVLRPVWEVREVDKGETKPTKGSPFSMRFTELTEHLCQSIEIVRRLLDDLEL